MHKKAAACLSAMSNSAVVQAWNVNSRLSIELASMNKAISGARDSAAWRDFLLDHADQDLLMVADGRRLYYGNHPINLHWLDKVSLLLIRQAYLAQQPLALCYPVPVCNLPVLAAAQLLIHDFVHNYPGNLIVLLISSRMEVREHYMHLRVKQESLAGALPMARLRGEGAPAIISVANLPPSRSPSLYHLARAHLLDAPRPRDIGVVIVDHATATFDDLSLKIHELASRHGVKCIIHLCTNPFAPFLEELAAAKVPVWVWDHSGLATDFSQQLTADNSPLTHPFGISVHQFQNIVNGIRHHVLVCRHPAFEAAAHRVWDDLGTAQRTLSKRAGMGTRRAIQAAYGTFYTMLQMVVPLPVYEEEARNLWGVRSVSRRIADLEAFAPLLRDETPELAEVYWPSLVADLKEMHEALEAGNPKYDTLVQQIREHMARKRILAIACFNQATRRMLQLCLRAREGLRLTEIGEREGTEAAVHLVIYRELGTLVSCDVLFFPGQFSYGRRQYALTAAAPEICYLAYEQEGDRIEQQIVDIHQTLSEIASPKNREYTWSLLSPTGSQGYLPQGSSGSATTTAVEFIRGEGELVSQHLVRATHRADLSLWTPFSTSEYDLTEGQDTLSSDSEETLRASEFAPSACQDVLVEALSIEFGDGFCYAEPGSPMTVFLTATRSIDSRRADGLRTGDIVVFVDGDQRRHLYEAILERIERHPAMGTTYILMRYWQQAVREGFFRSGLTYEQFLEKLRQIGSEMQTAAGVRFWVTGEVLGPSDDGDIQRVGMVFKDKVLVQEWKNIGRALKRIRGIHVSLARKLNRMIVEAGLMSQDPDASEECIDPELNLYLDDFRDSVTLHRVLTVGHDRISVPYMFTGRFFSKGTELKW